MILPGHLSGGYLATKGILAAAAALYGVNGHLPLSPNQLLALTAIGTLSGEFPDIDLAFFYLEQISTKRPAGSKRDSHRQYVTHVPLFWLAIGLAIAGVGWLAGSLFTVILGLIVWIGPWSHFVLDSFEYGIRWLSPMTDRRFALMPGVEFRSSHVKGSIPYYWELITKRLWKRPVFWFEIAITAIALWVAFL